MLEDWGAALAADLKDLGCDRVARLTAALETLPQEALKKALEAAEDPSHRELTFFSNDVCSVSLISAPRFPIETRAFHWTGAVALLSGRSLDLVGTQEGAVFTEQDLQMTAPGDVNRFSAVAARWCHPITFPFQALVLSQDGEHELTRSPELPQTPSLLARALHVLSTSQLPGPRIRRALEEIKPLTDQDISTALHELHLDRILNLELNGTALTLASRMVEGTALPSIIDDLVEKYGEELRDTISSDLQVAANELSNHSFLGPLVGDQFPKHDEVPVKRRRAGEVSRPPQDLQELFLNPKFFLRSVSKDGESWEFIEADVEALHSSSFLDLKRAPVSHNRFLVPRERLLDSCRKAPEPRCHFIFHTAFGGSTLVTRLLGEAPHCLTLREPGALMDLANLKREEKWSEQETRRAIRLAALLLSKPRRAGDVTLIKPSNSVNPIAAELLTATPSAKAILLSLSPEESLFALLRIPRRRVWTRRMLKKIDPGRAVRISQLPIDELEDTQAAALLVAVQSQIMGEVQQAHPDRTQVLASQRLFDRPEAATRDVTQFLGLDHTKKELEHGLTVFGRHAKTGEDMAAYFAEVKRQRSEFRGEIARALEWLEKWS